MALTASEALRISVEAQEDMDVEEAAEARVYVEEFVKPKIMSAARSGKTMVSVPIDGELGRKWLHRAFLFLAEDGYVVTCDYLDQNRMPSCFRVSWGAEGGGIHWTDPDDDYDMHEGNRG